MGEEIISRRSNSNRKDWLWVEAGVSKELLNVEWACRTVKGIMGKNAPTVVLCGVGR